MTFLSISGSPEFSATPPSMRLTISFASPPAIRITGNLHDHASNNFEGIIEMKDDTDRDTFVVKKEYNKQTDSILKYYNIHYGKTANVGIGGTIVSSKAAKKMP